MIVSCNGPVKIGHVFHGMWDWSTPPQWQPDIRGMVMREATREEWFEWGREHAGGVLLHPQGEFFYEVSID